MPAFQRIVHNVVFPGRLCLTFVALQVMLRLLECLQTLNLWLHGMSQVTCT